MRSRPPSATSRRGDQQPLRGRDPLLEGEHLVREAGAGFEVSVVEGGVELVEIEHVDLRAGLLGADDGPGEDLAIE